MCLHLRENQICGNLRCVVFEWKSFELQTSLAGRHGKLCGLCAWCQRRGQWCGPPGWNLVSLPCAECSCSVPLINVFIGFNVIQWLKRRRSRHFPGKRNRPKPHHYSAHEHKNSKLSPAPLEAGQQSRTSSGMLKQLHYSSPRLCAGTCTRPTRPAQKHSSPAGSCSSVLLAWCLAWPCTATASSL